MYMYIYSVYIYIKTYTLAPSHLPHVLAAFLSVPTGLWPLGETACAFDRFMLLAFFSAFFAVLVVWV